MADIVTPESVKNVKVVLNEDVQKQIDKFIDYYKHSNEIINSGMDIPNSILLYGPPGCGKTKLAKYLCEVMDLPLVVTRLDGLISSFLGNTAKNIRQVFEYAQSIPCILFLDEFDAIAKVRDDQNELGELKRVVNSLLQNIDNLNNGSIVIAATNHEQLLDSAVWRRFNFRINIEKPNLSSREELFSFFLVENNFSKKEIFSLAKATKDLSGSDIEEICNKSRIDSILLKQPLQLKQIYQNYFDFIIEKKGDTLKLTDEKVSKAKHLRKIDSKVFSYQMISESLGISKTSASMLVKEDSGEKVNA